jgi:hypothetical protein
MGVFGTPPPSVQSIIGANAAPVPARARLASETERRRIARASNPSSEVREAVDIVDVTELDEPRAVSGGNDEETNQQRREHDALPHPKQADRPRLDVQA